MILPSIEIVDFTLNIFIQKSELSSEQKVEQTSQQLMMSVST